MLDRLEETARPEAEKPLAAQLLYFFARKRDLPAVHGALAEREVVIAEILEHVGDIVHLATSGEGQESGGKEIEETMHAYSAFLVLIRNRNVQTRGSFHRQLVPGGGEQKLRYRARGRYRIGCDSAR